MDRWRRILLFAFCFYIGGTRHIVAEFQPKTPVEKMAYDWVRAGHLGVAQQDIADHRRKEIREAPPEIKKALLDIANYCYTESGEWVSVGVALDLLHARNDLTDADVRPVANELINIAQGNPTASGNPLGYVPAGLDLLSVKPTPDAEDIVMLFLEPKFRSYHYDAALSLAQMGTVKSVTVLRDCIEKDRQAGTAQVAPWVLEEMTKALSDLEKRVEISAKGPANTSAGNDTLPELKKGKVAKDLPPVIVTHQPEGSSWIWLLLMMLLASAGAIWIFTRKAK